MIFALLLGASDPAAAEAQGVWTGTFGEIVAPRETAAVPLQASFTLDGVLLSVRASFLPSMEFVVSSPGSTSQVATSVAWKPFREFSVTAIPFGTKPGTEALPVAAPGLSPSYLSDLRSFRLQQGGKVQDGSTVSLFGQQVAGISSLVDIIIDGPLPKPVVIDEWVVEAGDRLWIIRWSEEPSIAARSLRSGIFPGDLVLNGEDLDHPSTVSEQLLKNAVIKLNQNSMVADLPTPSWWQGDCDLDTYQNSSQNPLKIASYRLGAGYLGTPACGPRPWYDSAPDVQVRFFPGSIRVLEWECVELSMRFLYLMYGIPPYSGNGSQVVWNYSGPLLVKISNGTVGKAPVPNDVLSYGSTSSWGHTSVVTASDVDGTGNGTITVIEQNAAASGASTLSVSNWSVLGNAGAVSGWLHANWHVEYFNDMDLNSRCYNSYENTTYIFKDWGDGSPANSCNSDNFSARFTSTMNFAGGNYNFHCQHDGGCRIVIDGQLQLDAWVDSSFIGHDWAGSLSGGNHEVIIEYFDSIGSAQLESFWSGAGFLPTGPGCTSSEWCGSYYGNMSLSGVPAIIRNEGDGNINYVWGEGGVGYGFPTDYFSARWERNVHFDSGYYRFHMVVDDGGRLWVNNNQVIDKWKNQNATEYVTPELKLEPSNTPIRFEYYENGSFAVAKMWWENLSVSKSGSGSGTVTSSPAGINCGLTCSALFNNTTSVTLAAVASTCSTFTGWSGGDCSGTDLCTVVDTSSAVSVTANFSLDACRIYLPLVIR